MGRIIVNVMPNVEAVTAESERLVERLTAAGVQRLTSVRPGRRYYLYVDGEATDMDVELVRQAAQALVDPATEKVTGVFIGGSHVTEEDDWDVFEHGIGAMAPIPALMAKDVTRVPIHQPLDLNHLNEVVDFRELAEDDSEEGPVSDPTKRL